MSLRSEEMLHPVISIQAPAGAACRGTMACTAALARALAGRQQVTVTVECYPGVDQQEVLDLFLPLGFDTVIHADDCALPPAELDAALDRDLTDDRVFGIFTVRRLADFYPPDRLAAARQSVADGRRVLVYGVGATLVTEGDVLVYADITRWELQLRFRRGADNWRTARRGLPRLSKYKRGYFAEWRWGDKVKKTCLPVMDFYLDTTTGGSPALAEGGAYRSALDQAVRRPFRLVPYYDPGVWGGDWMKRTFDLPENGSNYAWSFDGVPEENSLLLGFGETVLETPAVNLVFARPRELLGERVHARFGTEFPIRFDMLDTIHGQNLSLQVHPLTEYIQDTFNMRYTQDESYYILDTAGEEGSVWLGIRTGTDPAAMADALRRAQAGGAPFDAARYVNCFPVKKHDHVLIPAGTVHGSGAGTMVLEISATPYIFTFKLWDWGRVDLDGKPRPIHLDHGLANIQWDRDTDYCRRNLLRQDRLVLEGPDGTVTMTGLAEREFIDTFRLTTARSLLLPRDGSVHMLNLVEGEEARITSPDGTFAPFTVHYAQTFILPEAAGAYRLESPSGQTVRAILARVRR
ncbi:class I mannose-6-phosphate isomerase [uncultured Gemmiger sp.]|uniref:class I mannose-6-phosphate isomerase n=1 Tax=uncultured Gemmiger sp. TaxID=1623490 RepID=UPI0025D3C507|nr:class I mannose-6-phosphate isomerase [uncultured Gemmiger sp.]